MHQEDLSDRVPDMDRVASQQVLASILRTAHQRSLDADDILTTLLQARGPIVAPQFYPASASVN